MVESKSSRDSGDTTSRYTVTTSPKRSGGESPCSNSSSTIRVQLLGSVLHMQDPMWRELGLLPEIPILAVLSTGKQFGMLWQRSNHSRSETESRTKCWRTLTTYGTLQISAFNKSEQQVTCPIKASPSSLSRLLPESTASILHKNMRGQ